MVAALTRLAPSLLLALAPAVELEPGIRSELRGRATQSGGQVQASVDLEVDPSLSIAFTGKTARLLASYAPRVVIPAYGSTALVRYLNQGELQLEGRAAPELRLFLRERGSYGETDMSLVSQQLATDPAIPLQPVPESTTVHYLLSETTAGLEAVLTRHSRLSLTAGWLVSGGVDSTAQQLIPLQRGPLAEASLIVAASRQDTLTTKVSGSSLLFTTGQRTTLGSLSESWSRPLSRSATMMLGVGIGLSDMRGAGTTATGLAWLPVGEASFTYEPAVRSQDLQFGLTVRGAPYVDRLTAEAYERVEGRLSAAWAATRALRVGAQAAVGVIATGARQGNTLAAVDLGLSIATGPIWALGIGVRGAHQTLPAELNEFGLFVSFGAQTKDRI